MRGCNVALAVVGAIWSASALSSPVLLSPDWATQACQVWNTDPVLTQKLVESKWVSNDKGRGYKVVQIYRGDCEHSDWVELRIAQQDNKAQCIYGGARKTATPDSSIDYVMHADTGRWVEMGHGDYGPMKAMALGRLQFSGPMWEAMNNMAPFENFLLLVGKVPADTSACPADPHAAVLPGLGGH
ncbi:MAG: sterol-binding protein [Nevskiaceae bacterium]|nr:MAG: sterol-binding protein [Nevskiaceae bacterium]